MLYIQGKRLETKGKVEIFRNSDGSWIPCANKVGLITRDQIIQGFDSGLRDLEFIFR